MRRLNLFLLTLLVAVGLDAQRIDDGLVFYAPFDGSTINLVEWVKPRNHGARMATDKFGKPARAIAFDGEDDYLDYGNIVQLGRRNFSISLWIKVDEYTPEILGGGKVINKGLGVDQNTSKGFGLRALRLDEQSEHSFRFTAENTTEQMARPVEYAAVSQRAVNQWYHLVMVREGKQTQIYLDGELLSTALCEKPADVSGDDPLSLGALVLPGQQGANDFFRGSLDEVRIYNRSLGERDIQLLYDHFLHGPELENKPAQTQEVAAEAAIAFNVLVYPNPTDRALQLEFKEAAARKMYILDGSGRGMYYGKCEAAKTAINVSGLPPGIYYLTVEEGDRKVVKQFVKVGAVLP